MRFWYLGVVEVVLTSFPHCLALGNRCNISRWIHELWIRQTLVCLQQLNLTTNWWCLSIVWVTFVRLCPIYGLQRLIQAGWTIKVVRPLSDDIRSLVGQSVTDVDHVGDKFIPDVLLKSCMNISSRHSLVILQEVETGHPPSNLTKRDPLRRFCHADIGLTKPIFFNGLVRGPQSGQKIVARTSAVGHL